MLYFGSADGNGVGQYLGYIIDTTTGKIGPNQVPGSPYTGSGFDLPTAAAISANKFVYFIERPSQPGAPPSIMGFAISPTGALAPVPGMRLYPGTTNNDPGSDSTGAVQNAVVADPQGRYLFVGTNGGGVVSYAVNSSTGQLTKTWSLPVQSTPRLATPDYYIAGLTIDRSGTFVYAVSMASGDIYGYRVGSGGVLSAVPGSPFAAGPNGTDLGRDSCTCLAVDKSNTHLYKANQAASSISAYTIDNNTGSLTPVPGSPFATADSPKALAADPAGNYLYVAGYWSQTLSGYAIAADGALTAVPSSPYSLPAAGSGALFEPQGRYLYIHDSQTGMHAYRIDSSTGELHAIGGGPLPGGSGAVILQLAN